VGQFTFHIFAAVAQFERDIIRMRTLAGLEAARARGRFGGRPKGLSIGARNKALAAETLYRERKLSISETCNQLGISKPTFYRYLRQRNIKITRS
jgi:DNA invertase Pin-like site-specific DNA recombinase